MEMIEKIIYKSDDYSYEIELCYVVKRKLKYYKHIGKCYPKITQCLLVINGLVVDFSSVTKHEKDEDNQSYALLLVTKKVMRKVWSKKIRKELWYKVFSMIEKNYPSKRNYEKFK